MTRDVYAGDEDQSHGVSSRAQSRVLFRVDVETDPLSLHRVVGVLACSNIAPHQLHCIERDDGMAITALFDGVSPFVADMLLRKLQQLAIVMGASIERVTSLDESSRLETHCVGESHGA